jgi:hypothetical protein
MSNTKQAITISPVTTADLMLAVAVAEGRAYGAKAVLAAYLNTLLPPMWHSAPKGKTPTAEAVEAKRIEMRDIYTAEGVAFFDQAWKVVKTFAAEIDAGQRDPETGKPITTEGEGEGEGEGGGGKQDRKDCDTAWLDDLAKLINRTDKDIKNKKDGVQASLHYVRIARRMVALSHDMSKLDKLAAFALSL